jgi:hypothetical protein
VTLGAYLYLPHDWLGLAWNYPRPGHTPPPFVEVLCVDTIRDLAHTDLEVG